jgi:hypothetical protein
LAAQLLFLSFKVIKTIAYVSTFYLLSSEVLYLICGSLHILFAKLDQTKVLFKIFLFSVNARFFNFQSIRIL